MLYIHFAQALFFHFLNKERKQVKYSQLDAPLSVL